MWPANQPHVLSGFSLGQRLFGSNQASREGLQRHKTSLTAHHLPASRIHKHRQPSPSPSTLCSTAAPRTFPPVTYCAFLELHRTLVSSLAYIKPSRGISSTVSDSLASLTYDCCLHTPPLEQYRRQLLHHRESTSRTCIQFGE